MNKKNKILVGCLALLLALSVGYALFSDTITINGTATAKGSFDITATCNPGILSKLGTAETLKLDAEGGYDKSTCSTLDNTVSINTEFLYPGARRHYTVKLTNNGTIDATIATSDITTEQSLCIAKNKEGTDKLCSYSENDYTFGYNIVNNKTGETFGSSFIYHVIGIEDASGNLLSKEQSSEFIGVNTDTLTLKPGYSVYLILTSLFKHEAGTGTTKEFFVEYNISIDFPFNQATN